MVLKATDLIKAGGYSLITGGSYDSEEISINMSTIGLNGPLRVMLVGEFTTEGSDAICEMRFNNNVAKNFTYVATINGTSDVSTRGTNWYVELAYTSSMWDNVSACYDVYPDEMIVSGQSFRLGGTAGYATNAHYSFDDGSQRVNSIAITSNGAQFKGKLHVYSI